MVMDVWRPRLLRSWRPFEEMERFLEEPLFDWPYRMMWRRAPTEDRAWSPAIEMYEKEDSFVVRAELPGVNKEDVDISVTGDTLTIKGERKAPEEVKDEDYCRCEVCYGPFSRSITMPAAVEASKIEASYQNGILEISLPKAKEAMPTKIEIKAK